jgi:membrane dipeptidase
VEYYYNKGIRMMSLTWNDDNELGCGAKTKNDTGLTELGFECVKKINELGIILDVSHLSEKGFWDVVSITDKPIVASHSNVYELCNNVRNLKDNQIKAIAKSGGVIGVCYYSDFLNDKKKSSIEDIVNHIQYIKDLVGIDYIGLGSDFDGMSLSDIANGVEGISKICNLKTELEKHGFNSEEIEKIMWNNWSKVFKKILK